MGDDEHGRQLLRALSVAVRGNGPVTVVFSHGFGTDQSVWSRILPYFTLSRRYRVITYDLMCAGTCDPNAYDFHKYSTLQGYVDDLLHILRVLRVERCAFVGHSISAMIGLLASILEPGIFARLILLGASPRFTNDEGYIGGIEPAHMEEVFHAMENNYIGWVEGFAPMAVGTDLPQPVQEFSRTLFNMRPDIALHVARTAFAADLRADLGQVTVPVFIIQSAEDRSVPMSVAEYLRDHLGGPTVIEVLRTRGHLPHLSAPVLVGPAIQRLLTRNIG